MSEQELVHIAGFVVTLNGRYRRQRCAWCGTIILDYDMAMMASSVDPSIPWEGPPMWPLGAAVAMDGTVSALVDLSQFPGRGIPGNSCTMIDPAVTA